MTRRAPVVALLCALAGCPKNPPVKQAIADAEDLGIDLQLDHDALVADLETSIREAHRALSDGYDEAYLDGLSRDARLTMIELGPTPLIGYDPAVCALRKQFDERVEFVSKRLDVQVSQDGQVGWSYDELSYRVWHRGRRAIIPVRATGVYERRGGKWLLVQEHLSYGIPDDEALAAVAEGRIARPQPIGTYTAPGKPALEVRDLLQRIITDADDTRLTAVSAAPSALFLGPDPGQVLRGDAIKTTPTVRALLGYAASVSARDLRVKVSSTGQTAWGAATLAVELPRGERSLFFGLRATWVLERADGAWKVVQTHVSFPICRDELAARAFGEDAPPPDPTPGCGRDQVAASSGADRGSGGGSARMAGSSK